MASMPIYTEKYIGGRWKTVPTLTTDANGEVTLPRIPAGVYELTLDKRGDEWTRVAVGDGETTIVQHFASN